MKKQKSQHIKSVTLDCIENLAFIVSKKTNKATQQQIQSSIVNFISIHGNKSFVDLYNETISIDNLDKALKDLKI
jgi:hypothetical protein